MADREEQRLVEQLVAHATVEAVDEPVLLRLARCDRVPLDASISRPREHRVRGQLGPPSTSVRTGSSPTIIFGLPRSVIRSASSRTPCNYFARHVVDDVRDTEPPTRGRLITHKVQAPPLVGQHRCGCARADGALASFRRRTVRPSSR